MRHRKNRAKLGRAADHRKALLRNLATSLALHGQLTTTVTKAKALVAYYERLIALAKRGNEVQMIRMIKSHLFTEPAQKSFVERVSKMTDRSSGYLRLTKIGYRDGDRAHLAQVDFVS